MLYSVILDLVGLWYHNIATTDRKGISARRMLSATHTLDYIVLMVKFGPCYGPEMSDDNLHYYSLHNMACICFLTEHWIEQHYNLRSRLEQPYQRVSIHRGNQILGELQWIVQHKSSEHCPYPVCVSVCMAERQYIR